MKELISLREFVLQFVDLNPEAIPVDELKKITSDIFDYAQFLSKPLELGMFIP